MYGPTHSQKIVGYHRNISQKQLKTQQVKTPNAALLIDPSEQLSSIHLARKSIERPLRPSLHKLINQHSQIRQYESTNIECEELRRVPYAQLQPDVRLRRVP